MNRLEAQQVVKQFGRIVPAFVDWREKRLGQAAAANGVDKAEEWSAMLDSITRTLSTLEKPEADRVLSRMEGGSLPTPPYGELALTILRESKIARQPTNRFHDSQPRYKCLDCLDSGIVNIWNPNFVEAYRGEFAKVTRTEIGRENNKFNLDRFDPERTVAAWQYDPPNWEHLAAIWWRKVVKGEGPIHHVALCNCDCPRKRSLEGERSKFLSGERRSSDGKRALPPACGLAEYRPSKIPRKTPTAFDDLHQWYTENEVNSVYEWSDLAK